MPKPDGILHGVWVSYFFAHFSRNILSLVILLKDILHFASHAGNDMDLGKQDSPEHQLIMIVGIIQVNVINIFSGFNFIQFCYLLIRRLPNRPRKNNIIWWKRYRWLGYQANSPFIHDNDIFGWHRTCFSYYVAKLPVNWIISFFAAVTPVIQRFFIFSYRSMHSLDALVKNHWRNINRRLSKSSNGKFNKKSIYSLNRKYYYNYY